MGYDDGEPAARIAIPRSPPRLNLSVMLEAPDALFRAGGFETGGKYPSNG
jgi:hypothetical protein